MCDNCVNFITTNAISGGTGSSFCGLAYKDIEVINLCVWGQYFSHNKGMSHPFSRLSPIEAYNGV
jgi:hypothetical protein